MEQFDFKIISIVCHSGQLSNLLFFVFGKVPSTIYIFRTRRTIAVTEQLDLKMSNYFFSIIFIVLCKVKRMLICLCIYSAFHYFWAWWNIFFVTWHLYLIFMVHWFFFFLWLGIFISSYASWSTIFRYSILVYKKYCLTLTSMTWPWPLYDHTCRDRLKTIVCETMLW